MLLGMFSDLGVLLSKGPRVSHRDTSAYLEHMACCVLSQGVKGTDSVFLVSGLALWT